MKKELEALNELRFEGLTEEYRNKCCDIVETALKRQDSIEITAIDIEQDNQALCKENKKLKQVLEIIKNKRVDLATFVRDFIEGNENYNDYYEDIDEYHYYRNRDYETPLLTQKEFDLLKEVLL